MDHHQHQLDQDEDDILLSLTGYERIDELETLISRALGLASDEQVTIVEEEYGSDEERGDHQNQVLFVVHRHHRQQHQHHDDGKSINDKSLSVHDLVDTLNNHPHHTTWNCNVVEMEEEVLLDEEEAYELWQNMKEDDRTCHLQLVPNPDGEMIRPIHNHHCEEDDDEYNENNNDDDDDNNTQNYSNAAAAIEDQLRRDPMLLELDNVPRLDCNKLLLGNDDDDDDDDQVVINWDEPFVITGCIPPPPPPPPPHDDDDDKEEEDEDHHHHRILIFLTTRDELLKRIGSAQVRTGNRNTLIESGFDNSKPLQLSKALATTTTTNADSGDGDRVVDDDFCGTIVFTPVKELPDSFQRDLEETSLLSCFPSFPSTTTITPPPTTISSSSQQQQQQKKYTLCISNQIGFGIGMHKHNQAMFLLLHGKKKWYMAPPTAFNNNNSSSSGGEERPTEPTHPGFYTTKSTHKCIQKEGEILYVPDQWYHEIFNLQSYTAGIQALPDW